MNSLNSGADTMKKFWDNLCKLYRFIKGKKTLVMPTKRSSLPKECVVQTSLREQNLSHYIL